ncbi:uncharacterized protein JN550_000465 [Neofusicoccum parvum]|uniref:Uncharacterized protein JN550_000465 n=1 Tax=Neofusicoccum parvum TaxID=310453 RepID=A0ACB5SPV2_9PEZI|nr:uncharacterized protein JN550_000465 [Neofusicoccum parvum]
MHFSTIIAPLFLAATAFAGHNCKCQDSNGQYNGFTQSCCSDQKGPGEWFNDVTYHGDQVHQCSSASNQIDSGAFVECCKNFGVEGAYCWD